MRSLSQILSVIFCSMVLNGCAHLEGTGSVADPSLDGGSDATLPESTERSALPTPDGPIDANFIEDRARQAYETGRWDVAEGYYLQLIRMKPGNAEPWFQLGNLYAEQGRLHSAERAYHEALRRRDNARTLHNLGLVQVKLGVGALREAQKRLPKDDPARQETYEFLRILLETVLP